MKSVLLREKDLELLRAALRQLPRVQQVRVFGSRANGTARRASDLDLAVCAPEATASDWSHILESLENAPLIYELDVVREDPGMNSRLRQKIEQEGVTVYSAR